MENTAARLWKSLPFENTRPGPGWWTSGVYDLGRYQKDLRDSLWVFFFLLVCLGFPLQRDGQRSLCNKATQALIWPAGFCRRIVFVDMFLHSLIVFICFGLFLKRSDGLLKERFKGESCMDMAYAQSTLCHCLVAHSIRPLKFHNVSCQIMSLVAEKICKIS